MIGIGLAQPGRLLPTDWLTLLYVTQGQSLSSGFSLGKGYSVLNNPKIQNNSEHLFFSNAWLQAVQGRMRQRILFHQFFGMDGA
jgi:hypothetical protein